MNADFSEKSGQGYPSVDLAHHGRHDSLPVVWQQFLADEPAKFIDQRADLLGYPDYLMALSRHYATCATDRHHLHKEQQRVIVAEFEGAVYDVLLEKLAQ
jgi:hypothetical protein